MTVNEVVFLLLREALFGTEVYRAAEIESERRNAQKRSEQHKSLVNEQSVKNSLSLDKEFWRAVYTELSMQAVLGLTASIVPVHSEIPEGLCRVWISNTRSLAIRYVQMAAEQKRACSLLAEAGIKVAVIKGMAAAIYYPVPEYRAMSDIDLLVSPEDYSKAIKLLRENGYKPKREEENKYHIALMKYKVLFELHKSPAGIHISNKGDAVAEYILDGLNYIETNEIGQDQFPILPWKQNGMELIWHIRQHLYNGLGLRQIIDWMMFVNYKLDDECMLDYMADLEKCGLDNLAIVVTKMCQKYLGLPHENITWCDRADESLCDELMEYIMGQGNFGVKAFDEKNAKIFSEYSSPIKVVRRLQELGKVKWGVLKKFPVLSPVAFLYAGTVVVHDILKEKGIQQIIKDIQLGYRRKRMLSELYGDTHPKKKKSVYDKNGSVDQ